MANYSDSFLKQTIDVWQPFSATPLNLEDAREIASNMTTLLRLIAELDKKYPFNSAPREMARKFGGEFKNPEEPRI